MSLFNTDANTAANSFAGPQSYYMNNPGWGMDPNLMTPSYAAPYRPEYTGYNPYVPNINPGFMASASRLMNPFYQPPIYQTPYDAASPYVDSFASKPVDAAAWLGQRVVVPGLLYGAASKMLGPNTGSIAGDIAGTFTGKGLAGGFGRGMATGAAESIISATGLAGRNGLHMHQSIQAFNQVSQARSAAHAQMMAAQAARTGFGSGMVNAAERARFAAGTVARGAASAYSAGGLSGVAALGARGVAGTVGAIAGSAALPLAAGYLATSAVENMVFDPYVNSRQNMNALRRNFEGVSFGDAKGDVVTGRGLSRREAARIGTDITSAGIQDFVFNTDEYSAIADMSARSGLLDGVKAGDISKRIKSISEQIKLIVSISKDPSVETAITELAKLSQAGASTSGGLHSSAAGAYSTLGMQARAAGTTVQKLMSTVGQQGQYLYQMNGMTPYLGQMAAADIFAGFSSAKRTGLLGPATLARMGGLEGATQSALTAQINAAQTPYHKMAMYNRYVLGQGGSATPGTNQRVVDVVSNFGAGVAGDPLSAMGAQTLFGNQMAARSIQEDGGAMLENQVISMLRETGARPADGRRYSASQLAAVMKNQMGLGDSEITAFMAQRAAESDSEVVQKRLKDYEGQAIEQTKSLLEREGLLDTVPSQITHAVKGTYKNVKQGAAEMLAYPVTRAVGEIGDAAASAWDKFWYGSSVGPGDSKEMTLDQLFKKDSESLEQAGFKKIDRAKAIGIARSENPNALSWWRTDEAKVNEELFGIKADSETYAADFKGFDKDLINKNTMGRTGLFGNFRSDESTELAGSLEKMAKDISHPGGQLARQFMKESDPEKRKKLLSEITRKHKDSFKEGTYSRLFASSADHAATFLEDIKGSQTKTVIANAASGAMGKYASDLDTVLGKNDLSTYDDLRAIGKVDALARLHDAGEIDYTNIDDYVDRDSLLKKLVGDRKGKDAFAFVEKIHNRGRMSGHLIKGRIGAQLGSVEELTKTGGAKIADEVTRARFNQAKSTEEKERILNEYIVQLRGGTTAETTAGREGMSLRESAMASSEIVRAGDLQFKTKMQEMTGSRVDYKGTYTDILKGFDKPIGAFGEAVEEFKKAVGRMSGNKPEVEKDTTRPGLTGAPMPDIRANLNLLEPKRPL